jgi:hypothetical protein
MYVAYTGKKVTGVFEKLAAVILRVKQLNLLEQICPEKGGGMIL